MLDQEQRHAGIAQLQQVRRESGAFRGVESGGRFVDEQQPRFGGGRARQLDAPPVAEREVFGQRRGERFETQPRERIARAFGRFAFGTARRR